MHTYLHAYIYIHVYTNIYRYSPHLYGASSLFGITDPRLLNTHTQAHTHTHMCTHNQPPTYPPTTEHTHTHHLEGFSFSHIQAASWGSWKSSNNFARSFFFWSSATVY